MGASFRNQEEIEQLAGCDYLTIGPKFLESLQQDQEILTRKLSPEKDQLTPMPALEIDEKKFRWMLNEDTMATDKLSEGIRKFTIDLRKLESLIQNISA